MWRRPALIFFDRLTVGVSVGWACKLKSEFKEGLLLNLNNLNKPYSFLFPPCTVQFSRPSRAVNAAGQDVRFYDSLELKTCWTPKVRSSKFVQKVFYIQKRILCYYRWNNSQWNDSQKNIQNSKLFKYQQAFVKIGHPWSDLNSRGTKAWLAFLASKPSPSHPFDRITSRPKDPIACRRCQELRLRASDL